jgi:hypothetical protein
MAVKQSFIRIFSGNVSSPTLALHDEIKLDAQPLNATFLIAFLTAQH